MGALGCNLTGGMRNIMKLRAVRKATDVGAAQRMIADALPHCLCIVDVSD